MDFDNSQPIYMQIINDYKKRIIRGEMQQGEKIPSQREYAQMVRVNPNTVQRAYREMENMNIVETLRGQGTFIAAGEIAKKQMIEQMASELMNHFLGEMRSLGYDDTAIIRMLEFEINGSKEDE